MLRASILLFIVALGLIAGLAIHFADDQPALYTYTGVDFCKGCHASTAAGEIYQIWQKGPHAEAFGILDSAKARNYIKEQHADIRDCLGCHSTLGREGFNDHERIVNSQGVGCERCHGAGSNYSQTITMKDRRAFLRNGGSPGSLANCYSCHAAQPDSQTIHCPFQTKPFNADSAWPQIAHSIRVRRSDADTTGTDSAAATATEPQPFDEKSAEKEKNQGKGRARKPQGE